MQRSIVFFLCLTVVHCRPSGEVKTKYHDKANDKADHDKADQDKGIKAEIRRSGGVVNYVIGLNGQDDQLCRKPYVNCPPEDNTNEGKKRKRRVATLDLKWPKNGDTVRVPFYFSEDTDYRTKDAFLAAVKEFDRETCIRFVPREENEHGVNVVTRSRYNPSLECAATVGYRPDLRFSQVLILKAPKCIDTEVAIHECLHVLGMWHTFNRYDRDNYIRINWWNLPYRLRSAFLWKAGWNGTSIYGTGFHFDSIMMYGSHSAGYGGQVLVNKADPSHTWFNNVYGWTKHDIAQVNRMYNCEGYYVGGDDE